MRKTKFHSRAWISHRIHDKSCGLNTKLCNTNDKDQRFHHIDRANSWTLTKMLLAFMGQIIRRFFGHVWRPKSNWSDCLLSDFIYSPLFHRCTSIRPFWPPNLHPLSFHHQKYFRMLYVACATKSFEIDVGDMVFPSIPFRSNVWYYLALLYTSNESHLL